MVLYHYSTEFFQLLKTRRVSGVVSLEDVKKAEAAAAKYNYIGAYVDHISFFFDPIPSKLLSELFDSDHKAWAKGTELFEYAVDVRTFPNKLKYSVVETPTDIDILDQTDWQPNESFRLEYMLAEAKRKQLSGETGTTLRGLKQQMAIYAGHTREYYEKVKDCAEWDEVKNMYAARVPHLMLYPNDGVVKYCNVKQLTIGNDTRRQIKNVLTAPSSKW